MSSRALELDIEEIHDKLCAVEIEDNHFAVIKDQKNPYSLAEVLLESPPLLRPQTLSFRGFLLLR